jgi:DNA-binding IclR family transcriptional regulator
MRVVKGVLDRSLEALEFLAAEARWLRLSDIAARLELPKGPTHRMLAQLSTLGWVEQDAGTGQYRLTLKMSLLGQQYLHGTGLPGLVQPILDEVAARCRELVRLTMVQGDELVWFASSQGAPPGLMYQPRMTGHLVLHATANGKAWLATMSNEDAVRIALKGGLGKPGEYGPRAVGTVEALLGELEVTRKRGYGGAIEEAEPGVAAVAVAVRAGPSGNVVGTMSIAGPLLRVTPARHKEFQGLLRSAADQLGMIWPRLEGTTEEPTAWTASASKA